MTDGSAARRFHDETSLTMEKEDAENARGLDWSVLPAPFKEYPGLDPQPLPDSLARLLRYGAGVARVRRRPEATFHFRTYSSAGARYPIELYVATRDGLHHFDPRGPSLTRLRAEDVRGALAPGEPAEAVLVLTGILERTAWKYTERGYRHLLWDAGTMLANLLALADRPRVVTSFADDEVDALLGIDGDVEVSLALLCAGVSDGEAPAARGQRGRVAITSTRYAYGLSRYPEVRAFHDASKLAAPAPATRTPNGDAVVQHPVDEESFLRRTSVRRYAERELPLEQVAPYLAEAMAAIPADAPPTNRLVLAAHRVAGLAPGFYAFEAPSAFEPIRLADVRDETVRLLLEQEFGGTGTGVAFLLADVSALDDRGYRWAQVEGGIRAGRLYVGAAARGWGATGSTFLDEDVSAALGTTEAPMLAVAFGPRPGSSSTAGNDRA
jgi:SagB-type dehydrogenase family enzyme